MDWAEYIRLRGSLNQGLNQERGFALLASIITRALGGKTEMAKFMPHWPSEDDVELPLEQALERWQ